MSPPSEAQSHYVITVRLIEWIMEPNYKLLPSLPGEVILIYTYINIHTTLGIVNCFSLQHVLQLQGGGKGEEEALRSSETDPQSKYIEQSGGSS